MSAHQFDCEDLLYPLPIPVHPLIIVLVLTGNDVLPLLAVVQIPLDGLLDAVGELGLRQPAQLIVALRRIDGIAHIVALAVGDVGDQAFGLAKLLADQLHNVDIAHLVDPADVVHIAYTVLVNDEVDGLTVILDIEPVVNVQALTIGGQGLGPAFSTVSIIKSLIPSIPAEGLNIFTALMFSLPKPFGAIVMVSLSPFT